MSRKLKVYLKLHWIKLSLIAVGIVAVILLFIVVSVGLYHFATIESFYRKWLWSQMPSQIFLYLVVGSISAAISTFIWIYFVFGGGFARMGQKKVRPEEVNIRWTDVVGMDYVKREVWEVISLVKDRAKLKAVGGQIIKGILMVGPPGCGKTYLAKAIATETGLPFLSVVGSEFIGIFVGLGASKLKSIFKNARTLAEMHGGCIIFIDEIDTIARPRTGDIGGGGAGIDYNATVNQLLTEIDGLKHKETNIIVIGATNVNDEELDPALMRAGRFDRKIYIDYPRLEDRKDLFSYYLSKVKYDRTISIDVLAKKTVYFSPADIANLVREASLVSVRNKNMMITMKDVSEAYDRVLFGLKSNFQLVEKEKIWVAYHEAGHAIIAYLKNPAMEVVKATIIPRKGYLGYAHPVPREELHIDTRNMLLGDIKTSLASYVAEKIKFGSTGSGVTADFASALKIAHDMVYRYGMGKSGIMGNFYGARWWGNLPSFTISESLRKTMDEDVQAILQDCLKEVEETLNQERELLEYFAQELLKKGELEYDEIVEVFKKHGKERSKDYTL